MKILPLLIVVTLFGPLVGSHAQDAPVDWKTLASEFQQDEAAAEAKYQGRMITVVGPVSGIADGDMTVDDPSVAITLSTEDGPGPDVKCLFETADLPVNSGLDVSGDGSEVTLLRRDDIGNVVSKETFAQTGQQVTVTGTFFGYQGGEIVLRHSRMVQTAP